MTPRTKKRATRTMYMHTVRGLPAKYLPGQFIGITQQGRYSRKGVTLVPTLAQIKREQRANSAWRKAQGYSDSTRDYSYVRVEVPSNAH